MAAGGTDPMGPPNGGRGVRVRWRARGRGVGILGRRGLGVDLAAVDVRAGGVESVVQQGRLGIVSH